MSNVKQKEGDPLMEKPQSVPGQEPDLLPPPYSSVVGSQSQAYVPVPSAPIETPYPCQAPNPVDSMVYNPMGQAITDYGKPVVQTPFNSSPYTSTTYDPMANVDPVNPAPTPHQRIIVSSQSTYSRNRARRCLYLKIFCVFATLAIIVAVGIRIYKGTRRSREMARHRKEEEAREEFERVRHKWSNDDEELLRQMNALMDHNNHLLSQHNNDGRKKRMAGQEGTDHFKNYNFPDLNDQPLIEKTLRSKRSYNRHRRETNSDRNKFRSTNDEFTARSKRINSMKKFMR